MVFAVLADSPLDVFKPVTLETTYGPFSVASIFDFPFLDIFLPPCRQNNILFFE
jgi:hypothetical protein